MKNLLLNRALAAKKKMFALIALSFVLFNAKAEITNLQTYVNGTSIEFYWQGDSTLSKIYEVGILENTQHNWISYVGAYPRAFVLYDGWYGFDTDQILQYGYNYTNYEGTASADYFTKEDWDASVDSLSNGLTLKPGEYIVYVEGYDGSYDDTTEAWAYAFVEIPGAQGINETESEKKELAKKIYLNGRLLIIRNETIYDVHGRMVK